MDPTHSRKRSIAFLSDKSTNDTLQPPAERQIATPSKRLQNSRGQAVPQNEVLPNYNAQRLLNNLAFTRLYVTANFQNYWPSMSPVILCLVHEQNDLYVALCNLLPTLYTICPSLQALAITAGYLSPNAMSDQNLMRILPLTTTSGLQGDVAEDFETFRQELGPTDCIVAVNAAGECTWTSRRSSNVQDLERGLLDALGGTEGDVAMGEG